MRFIRFLLEVSWRNIVIAATTGLVSGCGNALLISLINRSVNQASLPNALLYFAGLAVFILVTSTLSQFMLIRLSQSAIYQLRLKLSQNILSSPLHHLERLGEHRLIATMTDDVRSLAHAVSAIPNICIDLATVLGCLVYLAWLSNTIFALTIAFTSLAIWCVQNRLGKARRLFSAAREEEDTLLQHFQAITKGTKELKLHRSRRNDFVSKNLQRSATSLRQKNTTAMKSFAIANGLGQLSQLTSLGFILFVLPWFMHIPLPMLSTYVLTSTFLAMPMQNLLNRLPDILRGNIALQKIERMKLSLASHSEVETDILDPVSSSCYLKLDQVTYLYHPEGGDAGFPPPPHEAQGEPPNAADEKKTFRPPHGDRGNGGRPLHHLIGGEEKGFLLGPLSLSLQPGEITYIVGGNGSGKSTLAKLIAGLYIPQSGAIELDGVPITDYNREWYRQHFSAIFTDFHLFDTYLGFNHMDLDQDVERYLRQLQLDHKVQVKDGVLSTTRLSQGQRKRLALLTAYLEDRPIYLFDEWASDQEPLFRDLFYKQILVKLKERGKVVLVITHDDRYFHLADRIIKLDYGKIESNSVSTTSYLK
ncbi:ATP-binding cassette domain-containing protein [Phormidium tenue FACHB-886]|nr:ATP-binding cassette domain-containing protein [Phormidium tenue FACHB-886]